MLAVPVLSGLLGAGSNQLVLMANHDKFPVMVNPVKLDRFTKRPALDLGIIQIPGQDTKVVLEDGTVMMDEVHCVMSDKTHLNALADVFDLGSIYSIGDLGLLFGGWLWPYALIAWVVTVVRKLREE